MQPQQQRNLAAVALEATALEAMPMEGTIMEATVEATVDSVSIFALLRCLVLFFVSLLGSIIIPADCLPSFSSFWASSHLQHDHGAARKYHVAGMQMDSWGMRFLAPMLSLHLLYNKSLMCDIPPSLSRASGDCRIAGLTCKQEIDQRRFCYKDGTCHTQSATLAAATWATRCSMELALAL